MHTWGESFVSVSDIVFMFVIVFVFFIVSEDSGEISSNVFCFCLLKGFCISVDNILFPPGVYSCVAGNILGETVSKAFLQINFANVPTIPNNFLIIILFNVILILNTAVKWQMLEGWKWTKVTEERDASNNASRLFESAVASEIFCEVFIPMNEMPYLV